MFISSFEKSGIQKSLKSLQDQISELKDQVSKLSSKVKSPKVKKSNRPLIRTADAPWGLKLDGTPRKRPGRVNQAEKAGQP